MSDSISDTAAAEITQQSYKSTDYSDQSWEVLGDLPETQVFIPMQIEMLPQSTIQTDPMFADYGGRLDGVAGVTIENRWQLPDAVQAAKAEEEEAQLFSEEEVQKLVADAEQNGRIQALEEAITLQNEKLGKIEAAMNNILQDMHKQFIENIVRIEKEALDLSLAISDKLMNHIVDVKPDYIGEIINQAISLSGTANISKIRISPQDMEFIEIVGISKQLKQLDSKLNFEPDPTIRAGCVLETSAGEVDFQLDQAFERIKDNVLRAKK